MQADPELRELAEEEIAAANARLDQLDDTLMALLVPRDAREEGELYLELRAGTRGDEAAIFAVDLLSMYLRYHERTGWRGAVESSRPRVHGGFPQVQHRLRGGRASASARAT